LRAIAFLRGYLLPAFARFEPDLDFDPELDFDLRVEAGFRAEPDFGFLAAPSLLVSESAVGGFGGRATGSRRLVRFAFRSTGGG
jgi:hypothetical protein